MALRKHGLMAKARPTSCKGVAQEWRKHGKCMCMLNSLDNKWEQKGQRKVMAKAWHGHGIVLAKTWQKAWQEHGNANAGKGEAQAC